MVGVCPADSLRVKLEKNEVDSFGLDGMYGSASSPSPLMGGLCFGVDEVLTPGEVPLDCGAGCAGTELPRSGVEDENLLLRFDIHDELRRGVRCLSSFNFSELARFNRLGRLV